MKREQHSSGGKLRGLFCLGLATVLAAAVALNTAAANTAPVQYDITVRSSFTHTGALSGTDLYFWGANDLGQLPGFEESYSAEPVKLAEDVTGFALSENRTLIVRKDGTLTVYGWEPTVRTAYPAKGHVVARDVAQVSASDTLAAYVTSDGALYAWGNLNDEASTAPRELLSSGVKKVSVGNGFGLALMENGDVYGWGSNDSYQTGCADDKETYVAEPVKVAENVRDISTGAAHSCLLKNDDTLWTCGDNSFGQTGVVDSTPRSPLTSILSGVRSVSAGYTHNFAVTNDGAVYAWGYGLSGQLGNNSTERLDSPTESAFDYVQVFACCDDTFGVSPDGYVFSFGNNTNFRLGKEDGSDSLRPVRILDQEMNWVYPEYKEEDLPSNDPGEDSSAVASPEPSVSPEPSHGAESSASPEPSSSPEPGTEENTFTDVPADAYYADAVYWALNNQVTFGVTDTAFNPNGTCTRKEAVSFLWRAAGRQEPTTTENPFTDVSEDAYYYEAVLWAVENHITAGTTDTTFGPDETCSRAQIVSFLHRLAGKTAPTISENPFVDIEPAEGESAPYYYNAVLWAVENHITAGATDTTFEPNDACSRAQIVSFLYRYDKHTDAD